MAVERVCKICGKRFVTKLSRIKIGKGKYCSRECYGRSKRKREIRTCPICRQEFEVISCLKKRFCSPECQAESYKKRETRTCPTCSKQFIEKPSRPKKFCCAQCRDVARRTKLIRKCMICEKETIRSKYCSHKCANIGKRDRIKRTCEWCGEAFEAVPSAVKKGHGRFCSYVCYNRWRFIDRDGRNQPGWQGGTSFEPYDVTFNKLFKKTIRGRDDYTCAICRLAGKNIHHVDYDKLNTVPDNCITLCGPCHGVTGRNRDYWQAALGDLMQRRMITCQN